MPQDLATKLLVKPDARVLLLNAPIGYARKLEPLPAGATVTDKRGKADVVVAFVRDGAELKRLAPAFGAREDEAIPWVCYPKGGAKAGPDLDRDTLHAPMGTHELARVTRAPIDRP